jgi:hypothetical protein
MDPDPDPRHPGTGPGSGLWKIIRVLADPQHGPDPVQNRTGSATLVLRTFTLKFSFLQGP